MNKSVTGMSRRIVLVVIFCLVVSNEVFSWSMAALPDTGQTIVSTETFGEDSDYDLNPPDFTDHGNGTVTDNVTGLIWQKGESGTTTTWDSAVTYCETLAIGGSEDWRLPSAHELFSIVNHDTAKPPLDSAYFTSSAEAEYWWSNTVPAFGTTKVWVVNSGGGIGAHPKTEASSKAHYVRCVRGTPGNEMSFSGNGNGTVTDNNTGLMWEQDGNSPPTDWEGGLQYCEGLNLANHDDWRLPNVKELRSINNDDYDSPSIDDQYFKSPNNTAEYWTSTSNRNHNTQAWYMTLEWGIVSHIEKTESYYSRCVRNAEEDPLAEALADVIRSLQVITGMTPSGVTVGDDFNGDSRIGLEEAVGSLKEVLDL
jgi:hypothetical protein